MDSRYYSQPGPLTSPGRHAEAFKQLPGDPESLMRIVQGVIVHEFVASSFYGIDIPEERKIESHIRPTEHMLDRIFELDARPLTEPRPPERRLVGVCRHFMVLLLAMLRTRGIPARGRCGFGAYFNPGYFEDHVVCEYWNASDENWKLADPQFDDIWRERLHIRHNVLDVPRSQFLIAGDAWSRWRAGSADPQKFGIIRGNLRGPWFLAVNLIQDVASLNKLELLRWDAWGAMPAPNQPIPEDQLAFFDQLAALTRDPDATFDNLRALYEHDDRVRAPSTVRNVLLNRSEPVAVSPLGK